MKKNLNRDIGGKWQILDYELFGELTCIPESGEISLHIHYVEGYPFKKLLKFNDTWDIKEIYGKTFYKRTCILLDCKIISTYSFNLNHDMVIKANYIIWDLDKTKDEDIKFNKMSFRLTNSLLWSEMQCFKFEGTSPEDKYLISCDFRDESVKIDNSTTIKFISKIDSLDSTMENEKIELYQYLEIFIKKKEQTHYSIFLDEIRKVINLIKFATNEDININEIYGYSNDEVYSFNNETYYHKISIVTSSMRDNISNKIHDMNYLYKFQDILNNNKIEVFFKKYEEYKNIYELYLLSYKDDISDEISFIYLIQALELIHRIKFKNIKSFFKHLEEKYKCNNNIYENIVNNSDQKDSRYIILRSRLIDLLTSEFDINKYLIEDKIIKLADILTNSRNYYTHFNNSKKNKCITRKKLAYAIYILRYFVKCYILLELNFDINYINDKTENDLNYISYYNMVDEIISEFE